MLAALAASFSAFGHRWRVGRGDRDAVDLLGDEVGDDLRLLVAAAVLSGADVEALDRAFEFLLRLLAAGERLVVEGIVGALGHEGECIGLSRAGGGGDPDQRARGDRACQ